MAIINSDYTDILQIIIECSDPDTKMWGHTESAPLLTANEMNQLMVGGSTGTKRQVIYANILDRINVIAAIVASGKTITIKKNGKEVVSSDDGVEFNNYLSELRRNFSSLYADVVNVEPIRYGILSEMSPYASRTRTKRGQIKDENVKAISEEILRARYEAENDLLGPEENALQIGWINFGNEDSRSSMRLGPDKVTFADFNNVNSINSIRSDTDIAN
jgi:hypothetical protein